MAELVAKTYASALFEVALLEHLEERIKEQINTIGIIIEDNTEYLKILSSPIISVDQKHELVKTLLLGRVETYLLNLVYTLIDNGRFGEFLGIIVEYNKLCEKLSIMSKKSIQLKNEVDSSLIGGILLKYGNVEIDGTVKASLLAIGKQIKLKTI